LRESEFIDTYLRLDEDGDYVVKSTPCPFLGADNFCSIYEQGHPTAPGTHTQTKMALKQS
jgi:hypothetical protein